ncbi:MAG: hypothetical protein ILA19_03240 [Bacilli bacterium]|nr:hypothetical protein [Bacilli bacterium]
MKSSLITILNQINNDAWCYRTYWKAERSLKQIKDKLTDEEFNKLKYLLILNCDPDCPDSHYSDYAGKKKVSDYIKTLIVKYEAVIN